MNLCFSNTLSLNLTRFTKPDIRWHQSGKAKCSRAITMQVGNVKLPRPMLIFVTPDNFSKDLKRAITLSKTVLEGGTTLIQVRDRKATLQDIPSVVNALLSVDIPPQNLVINGMKPADVLAIHPSLGIHIKEKDIPEFLPLVKEEMRTSNVIGCAVHNTEIAKEAIDILNPDYFQVGTMFATQSHPGKLPEGPGLLQDIRQVVGNEVALVGIGGISNENVPIVMQHGADGIATVTLLSEANDVVEAASSLMEVSRREYQTAQSGSVTL